MQNNQQQVGKVWLVGAGPSDVGLLTLKAKEVIEQADVVVYDALVGAGIMALIPPMAECINAGKRASNHIMRQEETNIVLLERALAGKRVVRLKGGDPFLFGRGGEELELLAAHNVPFEVVPGVTSAISVPAYCGIPVTHRDFCSSVHIITGHQKQDEPLNINFTALAGTGGTLVFLMGISALGNICQGLLDAGMDATTPAAVLQRGTSAEQRTLVADLATLPARVKAEKVQMPAIIVVGAVCGLAEKFAWAEKLPLFGCRVVVTRPRDRATTLSNRLRALGAQVIEAPAIRTVPNADTSALDAAVAHMETYQWVAFTSPAGVPIFMDALRRQKMDVRALHGIKIAALGAGTAKELEKVGMFADLIPEVYDAEHLGEAMSSLVDGAHVLLPRASAGNPILPEILRKSNAIVDDLPVYDTLFEKQESLNLVAEFTDHPQTVAVFTSASTVGGFAAAAEGLDLTTVRALCIGKQTAQAAQALGMQISIAEKATLEALVNLVQEQHTAASEE